ncbi:hypothetical protein [Rhizobium sp. Root1220]|nr:hypothetical protein [Rhizobium sp. Root1220]
MTALGQCFHVVPFLAMQPYASAIALEEISCVAKKTGLLNLTRNA